MSMCLPLMLHALSTLPLNSESLVQRISTTSDCLKALCANRSEFDSG
jgi:hypothetical protein